MVILGANYKYNLTYLQKLGLIYNGNSSFAGKHLSKNTYVHFTGSLVKKQKMPQQTFAEGLNFLFPPTLALSSPCDLFEVLAPS